MSTYNTDFYSWTQQQAALLRQGCLAELDIPNLLEEIESMGRSEKRELKHRLAVLLAHLLKWHYQSKKRSNSWEATIRVQRLEVQEVIRDNPGLKPTLPQEFIASYQKARLQAMEETGLKLDTFPNDCPWTLGQVLDDSFWPV